MCQKTMAKYSFLIIALIASISTTQGRTSMSQDEGARKCMARTGLTRQEINKIEARNDGCSVDCLTRQGTVQTFYMPDDTECNDAGYQCFLGKCLGPDVERSKVDTNDLYNLEFRVVSAHVPDLDTTPSKGNSDTYVIITAEEGAHPTYNDQETICHTYTVIDDANPEWRNFLCKPLPMRRTAMVTFAAWDSDKPMHPDLLGKATESLDRLINEGPTKLQLVGSQNDDEEYFIVVDVKGEKYNA